jgi:predicted CxxxxCH...CXXCH cytochrome family protein
MLAILGFAADAAQAGVLNSCTTYCHGMPPRDSIRKANPHFNSQSSAFLGNHRNHLSAAPATGDCAVCHTSVASTDFGHNNDVITMANSLKGYSSATIRAKYDKGRFFNQTSIPNLTTATCSNVSCHFETKTSAWGSAAYTAPANCNACHGFPPAGTVGAPSGGLAGSHTRHNQYYPGTAGCQKCHPDHSGFIHATSAGRPLKVQGFLRDPLNALEATGSYTGSGLNYLPSKSANPGFGTCSNLYCHSTAQSTTGVGAGTTVTTPAWGSTTNCGSCHVNMATNASATGSHPAHAQSSGTVYSCAVCHGSSFSATMVNTTSHVNKRINLAFTANAAVTTYYVTKGDTIIPCAASNCHGAMSPVWGANTAKIRCQKCHGYRSQPWNALDGNTQTDDAKAGAHFSHISSAGGLKYAKPFSCTECHLNSISLSTDNVNAAGHFDTAGPAEIFFSSLANTKSSAPTYTAPVCNNNYCHGNNMNSNLSNPPISSRIASPSWNLRFLNIPSVVGDGSTTPGSGDCSKCHGYPPMTAVHAGKLASECIGCHNHVNTAGTGFTDAAKHVNGVVDGGGGHVFPYPGSVHDSLAVPISNCTSCHTNVSGTYPVTRPAKPDCRSCHVKTSPGTGCNTCHGRSTTGGAALNYSAARPNGGITGGFPNYSGSHTVHVIKKGFSCDGCHNGYGTGNTNHGFSNTSGATYSRTNFKKMAFTIGGTPTYTRATTTCSNLTGCHGTAVWGGRLGCINCHSAAQAGTHGTPRAAVTTEFGLAWGHKKAGRGAVTDADCIVCHLEGDFATQSKSAKHGDGNIDLRDPDGTGEAAITNISGGAFTFTKFAVSYAAGSRTSTGHLSDTDIANVISQKFCLACHDSNGANNPTARTRNAANTATTGTAMMPFEGLNLGANYTVLNGAAAAGGLVNAKTQFAPTNSSVHPVMGPRNKDYPTNTRLLAPYNNIGTTRTAGGHVKANSVVMNCFDCHTTGTALTNRTIVSHGNAVTLRGTIYVDSPTLCTSCHSGYTATDTHGTGSAMNTQIDGGENMGTSCQNCHSSQAARPTRPRPAADYHGFNALPGGGLWPTVNSRPYAFIRSWTGTAYHRPYRATEFTTGTATCGTGACPGGGTVGDGSDRTYSPGGSY